MQTRFGRAFYPLDPRAEDIDIADIAAHLSKLCRYTGATKSFYSVAQHSVIVSYLVTPEHARWGLLHDAAEAYTGDMSRPMKLALRNMRAGRKYNHIGDMIDLQIVMKFGLAWPRPPEVKTADVMAAALEQRDVMVATNWKWPDLPEPVGETIIPAPPDVAEWLFLRRYMQLWGIAA